MQTTMAQRFPQSTSHQNVRVVRMEPHVKSDETCKLFNRGVSENSKTGKSADPTCYNAVTVKEMTGLFENVEMNMQTQYPAGGPRAPVYDLMRRLGFSMAKFGDKTWTSADGLKVHIYGAGSMARLVVADAPQGEYSLDDLPEQIDGIRRHFNRP